MANEVQGEVTRLLRQIDGGDADARDRLLDVVYDDLRKMAGGLMHHENPAHTLQPTALVHEAALRLFNTDALRRLEGRAHFFGAMARAMRRILVDHARRRNAERRGGSRRRVPLDVVVENVEQTSNFRLLDLEESLKILEEMNRRQGEVVTLRFFGGLEMSEISEALDVSLSTVEKDWRIARAWLRSRLTEGPN